MKWIDARKYWPPMDAFNIVVDGVANLTLKSKYVFHTTPEGGGTPFSLFARFYCLVKEAQPWSGGFDNDFDLSGAIFYEIDEYCCNGEEEWDSHDAYRASIGLYIGNIPKFVNKGELTACMDLMSRWAYLEEDSNHE